MGSEKEIIRIEDLNKTFHTKDADVTALDQVNLAIREGEIFGIIGLSGAGKSTLVRCMNLLEKPTRGHVYFDGKDLGGLSAKELNEERHSIGMIFQSFNLLMQRTALQNICFPLELTGTPKAKARERARELLQIVSLEDKENAYPAQLSGGQKQRVAIARALATNPKVLLCDEATSALDPNTTRAILALLKDINRKLGVTIVVITHEMSVIEEICGRVAIIDQSHIVEMGKVEDIFVKPQSRIARQLLFPGGRKEFKFGKDGRFLRIVFDGMSSYEPVISGMVLECGYPVNIMFADTRDIDGKAMGQIILALPDDERAVHRMYAYLNTHKVRFEEVKEL
ncbi:MAG: ATP-binding cassette domain-containing protein [Lachnospiraceae bacterium]|jgi:D-methionine transport system ATP-binding protein|nr:ATP-binding cassette domain-containing protein [Lachnospiraceae bacterium]